MGVGVEAAVHGSHCGSSEVAAGEKLEPEAQPVNITAPDCRLPPNLSEFFCHLLSVISLSTIHEEMFATGSSLQRVVRPTSCPARPLSWLGVRTLREPTPTSLPASNVFPIRFVGVFPPMGSRGASEHDNIMSLLMTVFSQAGSEAIING